MTRRGAVVVAGVAVLVAALLAGLFLQDADDYRDEVASLLGDALGQPVTVSGGLTLVWQPSPALTAREVTLSMPQATVRIASVRVVVDSGALLMRRLRATELHAEGVDVALSGPPAASLLALARDPGALPVGRLELRELRLLRGDGEPLRLARLALSETQNPDGVRLDVSSEAPRLRGRARVALRGGALALTQIELHTVLGVVEGALTLEQGAERPRLSGELRSNALSLSAAPGDPGAGFPSWLRPDPAALGSLDARLTLRVGRLSVGGWRLSEVEAPLRLRGGAVELPVAGVLAGGPMSVVLGWRPADGGTPPRLRLALELRQANGGDTLVMAGLHGAERGGRLDLSARLAAEGASAQALLASLDGELAFDAREVTLRASAAELAASDVFARMMRMLRGERGNRIGLECVTAGLGIRGGVLLSDASLGIQSRAVNAVGGGRLSLPQGEVALSLRPWPREGLGPSARAVADALIIEGPLDAPAVRFLADAPGGAGAALDARLREKARGDAPCARPGSTVPDIVPDRGP